jgi:hypothetical protein
MASNPTKELSYVEREELFARLAKRFKKLGPMALIRKLKEQTGVGLMGPRAVYITTQVRAGQDWDRIETKKDKLNGHANGTNGVQLPMVEMPVVPEVAPALKLMPPVRRPISIPEELKPVLKEMERAYDGTVEFSDEDDARRAEFRRLLKEKCGVTKAKLDDNGWTLVQPAIPENIIQIPALDDSFPENSVIVHEQPVAERPAAQA